MMKTIARALTAFAVLFCSYSQAQVMSGSPIWKYSRITTDTTITIKGAAGVLHTICINNPAATETITVYDNTSASGTLIAAITEQSTTQGCFLYDASFTNGLTIVTAVAAGDITVSWN